MIPHRYQAKKSGFIGISAQRDFNTCVNVLVCPYRSTKDSTSQVEQLLSVFMCILFVSIFSFVSVFPKLTASN